VDKPGINITKSVTILTQQIEFQGKLYIPTVEFTRRETSSGEKLHHIRIEVTQHLQKSQVTAHQVAQLIGKLHAALQAVLPAPLFYRSLQVDLQSHSNQNYSPTLALSPQT